MQQIECLKEQMRNNYWDCEKSRDDVGRDKAILKDIQQHKIGREKGIGDGVVNGKLWKSLGSQESIRVEVSKRQKEKVGEIIKVGYVVINSWGNEYSCRL